MYFKLKLTNLATILVIVTFFCLAYLIWTTEEHFPEVVIELHDLLSYILLATELGGRAILDVSQLSNLETFTKKGFIADKTEILTRADLLSNQLIFDVLQRYPGLRVISEERKEKLNLVDHERYLQDEKFYVFIKNIVDLFPSRRYPLSKLAVWVDPLDATQEFTEGLFQYVSVMLCITVDNEPIFGSILRPFSGERVYGLSDFGIIRGNGEKWSRNILLNNSKIVLVSRSHSGDIKRLLNASSLRNLMVEFAGGSGYKTLRLLNGSAELYMHKTNIKKWDTCADDALLRSVGGLMLDFKGNLLNYDPDGNYILRDGFIAAVQYPFTYFQRLKDALSDEILSDR